MSKSPYFYETRNIFDNQILPSELHNTDSISLVIKKYLFEKAMAVFNFKLPPEWSREYFLWSLFEFGYVCVFYDERYGAIFQNCEITGYDIYYRPTNAIVETEFIHKTLRIGEDCELLKLTPTYTGIWDLINFYGDLLAHCYSGETVNILNSKLSYVFAVKNNAAAEAFKKLTDKILSGSPAVIADKNLLDAKTGNFPIQYFAQNLRENFIAPELVDLMNKIEMRFDTEIGIPTANTAKKTQMTDDEVNANNVETFSKASLWLQTMQEDIKKINKKFNLSIGVDWRVPPIIKSDTYGGVQDEINIDNQRII